MMGPMTTPPYGSYPPGPAPLPGGQTPFPGGPTPFPSGAPPVPGAPTPPFTPVPPPAGRSLLRWVVLLTIADIVLAFLNFLWGIFLGLWLGNSGLDTAGIQLFMTVTSSAWTALFVLITLTVLVLIALSWRAASRAARGGMVLICAMLAARWLYSAAMSVVVIPALVRSGIPPTTFSLWLTVAGVSWLLVSTALLAFGAYRTHRGGAAA